MSIAGARLAALAAGVLLLLVAAMFALATKSQRMQPELGLVDGRLRPCPPTPNCVCSENGTDAARRIDPLAADWPLLRQAVIRIGGAIDRDDGRYLHASFRTPLFGFVDDLEARLDVDGRIQLRSASRVGRSDFGANRRRITRLRRCVDAINSR